MPSKKPARRKGQPLRAAIYARISQAKEENTTGVDRQVKECKAYCAQQGLEAPEIFIDNNRSAFKVGVKREAYEAMMTAVDNGEIDVIVAWAADRIYRRLADLEDLANRLKAADVTVQTVKSGEIDLSTADGRFMAAIIGSAAKRESEKIGERVSVELERRASEGLRAGGPRRFGYNNEMTELIPLEAKAVRDAYKTIAKGGSIRSICMKWDEMGLQGPRGGAMQHGQVRQILLRAANAGIHVHRGEEIGTLDKMYPRLIDASTFRVVEAILRDPKRVTTKNPGKSLLGGVLVCGACGIQKVTSGRTARKQGHRWIYRCATMSCNNKRSRDKAYLESAVVEAMFDRLENRRKAGTGWSVVSESSVDDEAQANAVKSLDKLRADLAQIESAYAAEEMPVAVFTRQVKRLNEKIRSASAVAAQPRRRTAGNELLQSKDLRRYWGELSAERQRATINDLIESITLGRGKSGPGFSMAGIDMKWRKLR